MAYKVFAGIMKKIWSDKYGSQSQNFLALNILYIHQYFKIPSEGGAIRSYYLAKGMIKKGHQVQMITSHNNNNYIKKDIEGITVHYLPVKYSNHFGYLRRIYAFLLFAHKAYYLGRKFKNIDLAYVTSTPLTVALTALRLKRKKQISDGS